MFEGLGWKTYRISTWGLFEFELTSFAACEAFGKSLIIVSALLLTPCDYRMLHSLNLAWLVTFLRGKSRDSFHNTL